MIRFKRHLSIAACLVLLAACGEKKAGTTSSADDRPATTSTASSPPVATTPPATTPPATTPPAATPPPTPMTTATDAQIVHILDTTNAGEVELGSLAKTKAKDPAVQAYAVKIIEDHGGVKAKTKVLATKIAVTPEDGETSRTLKKLHDDATARLTALEGAAFDKAYVDATVEVQTAVLDIIDRVLIPSAENAELEAWITEIRPTIATHLDEARKLQTKLGTAPTTL